LLKDTGADEPFWFSTFTGVSVEILMSQTVVERSPSNEITKCKPPRQAWDRNMMLRKRTQLGHHGEYVPD
jgi:hypothetical protein